MQGTVVESYEGVRYQFTLPCCDSWTWAQGLVRDKSLANLIMWTFTEKFIHDGDKVYRLNDEPNTAERWRKVDVKTL
jgi:hypothetical protein